MVRPVRAGQGNEMAATKLRPPAGPPRLVERSRLAEVLDGALTARVPLVLVSAPAGSGKSTLLASWAAARQVDVAWLQLEESDADPARFWASVVAAVGRSHPEIAAQVGPLVAGSQGAGAVVVPALVNALAELDVPVVLVLDDYHLVDETDVHRAVERLIELCPPQLVLVLATRADPPFRLGRMRVRDRLREIRAADLRFDHDEAAALLGPAAAGLDARRLDDLCERTEGWAAGLVLAGLSLTRTVDAHRFVDTFRGDDQLVAGYLADELLAVLEPDERRRMVEAAVLHRLTGPLLDEVTGSTDGARWLDELAARNQLVLRLDSTGEWFRYHHLFRDLLLMEARRSMPERLPQLHRSAAAWFLANGYAAAAVDHLLQAGEREQAMDQMRLVGPDLLGRGQLRTLRNILERIAAGGDLDTICSLLLGWDHYLAGRYDAADRCIADAFACLPDGFDVMRTMPLRINVALGRGDVGTALALARTVTGAGDLASRPSELTTAVGAAYAWAGLTDEARDALGIAAQTTVVERRITAQVMAAVALAVVELHAGDRERAHVAAADAVRTAAGHGLADYHGVAPAYAVRAAVDPDPEAARADAEHAVQIARDATTMLGWALVLTVAADVRSREGDPSGSVLLAEAREVVGRCVDSGIAGELLARVAAHRGEPPTTSVTGPAMATARRPDRLVEPLSERELAVLRHLPSALSLREIAGELYVSLNTVKTQTSAIYRKLAVGDRRAAVRVARERGLL